MAMHAKDVKWRLIGGFASMAGPEFTDRAEVRRWFTEMIENLGSQLEIENILEADDRLVVIARAVAVGSASGAPATLRFGQVYSFRDGQISAVDSYYEASEALKAVGLEEWAMSQENVEVVRAVFEAWNEGDMEAFRELHDPDIIMRGCPGIFRSRGLSSVVRR